MTTARPRAFREKLNSSHLSLFFSPGGAFFLSFHEGRPLPPSDVLLQGRGIASPRFNVLVTEKEELAKGMDEEILRVNSEIQELDKLRSATREDFEEQRRLFHADAEELERRKASLTGMIETARRHCVQLDSANTRLDEDRNNLLENEKQLRNDIRESDTALADAVAANERLREQMEETRVQAQQQCERDQALLKESYDQKIKDQKASHEQDVAFMEQQVRNLEQSVATRYGDVEEARHACDKLQVGESFNFYPMVFPVLGCLCMSVVLS